MKMGKVRELVRYPVKSMAGIAVESAFIGWHGLEGDRRFAFRRLDDRSGFPWLSASRLPELVLYHPEGKDEGGGEALPTHVRTPRGAALEIGSTELNDEISARLGNGVELMKLRHGVFDEAPISLIALATVSGIGREAGLDLDRRRFRANIAIETVRAEPFLEDEWIAGTIAFGEGESGPAIAVTTKDPRCVMINFDPDTAKQDARVLKAVVRLNQNDAGVYANVIRTGIIKVGDPVRLV